MTSMANLSTLTIESLSGARRGEEVAGISPEVMRLERINSVVGDTLQVQLVPVREVPVVVLVYYLLCQVIV